MTESALSQLVTGIAVGVAAGYVGSLMVLRRMSLVGDALSHVALPGIAAGLLLGFDPFIGAFAVLAVAVIAIWWLGMRTVLPSDALVGIFFTLSLAVGLILTPEHELLEALLGDITRVSFTAALLTAGASLAAIIAVRAIRSSLILDILSPELAKVSGLSAPLAHLLFLLLVAMMVALGLRITGTLLTGALVIIPAAAARNVSPSLGQYTLLSASFGGFAASVGIIASWVFGIHPGPLVILVGGILFAATLPFRR